MKHIKKPYITVAVTAYKRPQMIEDVIRSYRLQGYRSSELLIVDDCVKDESVKTVVRKYQKYDKRIRFIKNKKNLGYSKNFLKSLLLAKGKYIVTLGDDDVFLQDNALQTYVEIFEKYPRVGYIYSNIMQFNNNYQVDFISPHFAKNTLFKNTEEALQSIWLSSCYIAGIGLRNDIDFKSLYPREDMLFPQVELLGKVLGKYQAFGIAEFFIGGRAHGDQLGFAAIQGEKIKDNEDHSVVELDKIFNRIKTYYKAVLHKSISLDNTFIHSFFEQTHATILPNEKIQAGNRVVWRTFTRAYKNNPRIVTNIRFMSYLLISLLLPAPVLFSLKELRKKQLIALHHKKEKEYFTSYMERIRSGERKVQRV